ncbi:putative titin-like, partial [Apostichopus japonicus]
MFYPPRRPYSDVESDTEVITRKTTKTVTRTYESDMEDFPRRESTIVEIGPRVDRERFVPPKPKRRKPQEPYTTQVEIDQQHFPPKRTPQEPQTTVVEIDRRQIPRQPYSDVESDTEIITRKITTTVTKRYESDVEDYPGRESTVVEIGPRIDRERYFSPKETRPKPQEPQTTVVEIENRQYPRQPHSDVESDTEVITRRTTKKTITRTYESDMEDSPRRRETTLVELGPRFDRQVRIPPKQPPRDTTLMFHIDASQFAPRKPPAPLPRESLSKKTTTTIEEVITVEEESEPTLPPHTRPYIREIPVQRFYPEREEPLQMPPEFQPYVVSHPPPDSPDKFTTDEHTITEIEIDRKAPPRDLQQIEFVVDVTDVTEPPPVPKPKPLPERETTTQILSKTVTKTTKTTNTEESVPPPPPPPKRETTQVIIGKPQQKEPHEFELTLTMPQEESPEEPVILSQAYLIKKPELPKVKEITPLEKRVRSPVPEPEVEQPLVSHPFVQFEEVVAPPMKAIPREAPEHIIPIQRSPPRVIRPLEDVETRIGEEVTLVCQVVGEPMPEITWERYHEPLDSDRYITTVRKDGTCILTITTVVEEDDTEFRCVATNPAGTVTTHAEVYVMDVQQQRRVSEKDIKLETKERTEILMEKAPEHPKPVEFIIDTPHPQESVETVTEITTVIEEEELHPKAPQLEPEFEEVVVPVQPPIIETKERTEILMEKTPDKLPTLEFTVSVPEEKPAPRERPRGPAESPIVPLKLVPEYEEVVFPKEDKPVEEVKEETLERTEITMEKKPEPLPILELTVSVPEEKPPPVEELVPEFEEVISPKEHPKVKEIVTEDIRERTEVVIEKEQPSLPSLEFVVSVPEEPISPVRLEPQYEEVVFPVEEPKVKEDITETTEVIIGKGPEPLPKVEFTVDVPEEKSPPVEELLPEFEEEEEITEETKERTEVFIEKEPEPLPTVELTVSVPEEEPIEVTELRPEYEEVVFPKEPEKPLEETKVTERTEVILEKQPESLPTLELTISVPEEKQVVEEVLQPEFEELVIPKEKEKPDDNILEETIERTEVFIEKEPEPLPTVELTVSVPEEIKQHELKPQYEEVVFPEEQKERPREEIIEETRERTEVMIEKEPEPLPTVELTVSLPEEEEIVPQQLKPQFEEVVFPEEPKEEAPEEQPQEEIIEETRERTEVLIEKEPEPLPTVELTVSLPEEEEIVPQQLKPQFEEVEPEPLPTVELTVSLPEEEEIVPQQLKPQFEEVVFPDESKEEAPEEQPQEEIIEETRERTEVLIEKEPEPLPTVELTVSVPEEEDIVPQKLKPQFEEVVFPEEDKEPQLVGTDREEPIPTMQFIVSVPEEMPTPVEEILEPEDEKPKKDIEEVLERTEIFLEKEPEPLPSLELTITMPQEEETLPHALQPLFEEVVFPQEKPVERTPVEHVLPRPDSPITLQFEISEPEEKQLPTEEVLQTVEVPLKKMDETVEPQELQPQYEEVVFPEEKPTEETPVEEVDVLERTEVEIEKQPEPLPTLELTISVPEEKPLPVEDVLQPEEKPEEELPREELPEEEQPEEVKKPGEVVPVEKLPEEETPEDEGPERSTVDVIVEGEDRPLEPIEITLDVKEDEPVEFTETVTETVTVTEKVTTEIPEEDTVFIEVIQELSDVTVDIGDEARFICRVVGFPRPTITWVINGQPLRGDRFISVYDLDGTVTLVITDVIEEDETVYELIATNEAGTVRTEAELIIPGHKPEVPEDTEVTLEIVEIPLEEQPVEEIPKEDFPERQRGPADVPEDVQASPVEAVLSPEHPEEVEFVLEIEKPEEKLPAEEVLPEEPIIEEIPVTEKPIEKTPVKLPEDDTPEETFRDTLELTVDEEPRLPQEIQITFDLPEERQPLMEERIEETPVEKLPETEEPSETIPEI